MYNLPHTTEELIKALESKGYTITPPKNPTGRMKVLPEVRVDDLYWYISREDEIWHCYIRNDSEDLSRFIHGNMYHDRESAEQAKPEYLAWLNSKAKVRSRIAELNPEGWEPDFGNRRQNYFFRLGSNEIIIDWSFQEKVQDTSQYMATREIAEQILAEMPEDVERMIKR